MKFDSYKKALREILSENGGNLSWGRVASSICLFASIAWVSHIIFKTGHMPDLAGVTGYVTAPYLSNKTAAAVQSFSNK